MEKAAKTRQPEQQELLSTEVLGQAKEKDKKKNTDRLRLIFAGVGGVAGA